MNPKYTKERKQEQYGAVADDVAKYTAQLYNLA